MKVVTLTQATKQHNTNRLHDAFILAGLVPVQVESSNGESRFTFQDAVTDPSIQTVITNYVFAAPAIPPNIVAMGVAYRNAVTNATTLAQCKAVLNNELWQVLKFLALKDIADM